MSTIRPAIRLGAVHTRYLLLETVRVPIAIIGALVFPALSFLFFVVPQRAVAEDPMLAAQAIIQLSVFAVLANGLFGYGLTISQARETPWDPYVRSLPVPASARILGQVFSTGTIGFVAVVPVIVIGVIATSATATPGGVVLGLVALGLTSLPFAFIGISIGYGMPSKAAIAVVQVVMFGLAFAGGLFLPPVLFPDWLDAISRLLPSRQAREVVIWVVQGGDVPVLELIGIIAWTIVLGVLALVLYRRDEGRRFR